MTDDDKGVVMDTKRLLFAAGRGARIQRRHKLLKAEEVEWCPVDQEWVECL